MARKEHIHSNFNRTHLRHSAMLYPSALWEQRLKEGDAMERYRTQK